MANRKLKNFEFANHSETGKLNKAKTDEVVFFESPNGNVFLICQDNGKVEGGDTPAKIAVQRIKYYLENEVVANPASALFNAIIYTNGFIHEYGRKNDKFKDAGVHAACVLIRDNKIWYTTIGDMAIFYFTGKKLHLLAQGVTEENLPDSEKHLLGQNRDITPHIIQEALEPVNADMMLMCSKGFYGRTSDKNIYKILSDPMPVQTKVYRFVDMASLAGAEEAVSIQLISFYNLDTVQRKFRAVEAKRVVTATKPPVSSETVKKAPADAANSNTFLTPPVKLILFVLAILLLGYMFYDLFIRNPIPPVNLPEHTTVSESVNDNEEVVTPVATAQKNIPEEVVYIVKVGDTWGKIYNQYEVCSWFVRNHESNRGKFDADENPVSGSRIVIPVIYSAKKENNPDFYQHFTLEKTGTRCENASQEFIDNFNRANNF